MIKLPRSVLVSAAAIGLLLVAMNIWFAAQNRRDYSETSFGVAAAGYKAAYELLHELGIPATRSYAQFAAIPRSTVLWLVSPNFLDPLDEHAEQDTKDLISWVRSGGTAVVLGDQTTDWPLLGVMMGTVAGNDSTLVTGDWVRTPRKVAVPGLLHFTFDQHDSIAAADFDDAEIPAYLADAICWAATMPHARLQTGDYPFALELKVGNGRMIAVADDRFLLNSNLGSRDNAVLLLDLVRATGAPVFDEHFHGLVVPSSAWTSIAHSRARLPIAIALLAALLWIAAQHSWPRRSLTDSERGPDPSVASFIDSLGALYAQSRDPAAAFRAYRHGFLRTLRHRAAPRAELSEEVIIQWLTRNATLSDEARRWIVEGESPQTEAALVQAVRALESCSLEVAFVAERGRAS